MDARLPFPLGRRLREESARSPRRPFSRTLAALAVLMLLASCAVLLRPVWLGGAFGYTIVSGGSMEPTLTSGDLVATKRQRTYERGDIVVYAVPRGEVGEGAHVVHRVAGGTAGAGYVVRGDAKEADDPWRPTPDDVIGKVVVDVPHVGYGLVFLRTWLGLAVLAGLATTLIALATLREPSPPASSP